MLHLRTLGAHDIVRDDGSGLSLQRRPFALLAFVAAAATRGVSREKALGVLWPDTDEERARHALAQTVYALRRACGGDVIDGTTTLCVDGELLTTDVGALVPALAACDAHAVASLYAGPFLDGFHLPNADEFERWVETERERIRTAVSRAYQRAAGSATAARDLHAATEWWRHAAALDPLDARVALALAESLASSGDVAAAVKHAELHQALRRAELDLPPDPALAALADRLRTQRVPATPPSESEAPSSALPSPVTAPAEVGPVPVDTRFTPDDATPIAVPANARSWRRKGWAIAGAIAVVALVVIGGVWLTHGPRPLDERRVVVAVFEDHSRDSTLAPLGDMAADWVSSELARTGLVDVVDSRAVIGSPTLAARGASDDAAARARDVARSVGAGIVVWGDYYRRGDSLAMHAEVTDVRDGALIREIPWITVPARDPMTGVQQLASRVMGALATIEDPRLAEWAGRGGTPPSYDAYREFIDGLEAHLRLDPATALAHYARATTIDSMFVEPLLFGADAARILGRPATAESLLTRVNVSRNQLVPAERDLLDFQLAELRGQLDRAYETATDWARHSPSAMSFVIAGQAALNVNRPREALTWFERVDPSAGWVKDWGNYWYWATNIAHLAGNDSAALQFGRRARRAFPSQMVSFGALSLAEASMGDVRDASVELDSATSAGEDDGWAYTEIVDNAARELMVHGHRDDAATLWRRAAAWFAAHPRETQSSFSMRDRQTRILLHLGLHDEALGKARSLVADVGERPIALADLGLAEVATGDTAAARSARDQLATLAASTHTLTERGDVAASEARVAAALGDRSGAVSLIREALNAEALHLYDVHRTVAFLALRGYAPFDDLMRPRG